MTDSPLWNIHSDQKTINQTSLEHKEQPTFDTLDYDPNFLPSLNKIE